MKVHAIVNAANTSLKMGGGVCGAIFSGAGKAKLQAACDKLGPIKTGEAVITPGFDLLAKCIIHTAGPIYIDGRHDEEKNLRSCYLNSLKLAIKNNCQSIAFPLISTGIFGYPKDLALKVATRAIKDFLAEEEMEIYLAVFDNASFTIGKKLFLEVKDYIDDNYVAEHENKQFTQFIYEADIIQYSRSDFRRVPALGLDELIIDLDEGFSPMLLRLIKENGKTDVQVYKRANLDRRLFSKIRNDKSYMPSKRTALAFAIALELSLEETDDLLKRAGFTLSHAQIFDVIIEYFILKKNYDIFTINEVLFQYDQPLLGG